MAEEITKRQQKIDKLKEENKNLQKRLEHCRNKEGILQGILRNYDNLLKQVISSKEVENRIEERVQQLTKLETAFYDLLQRYEKAKKIVQGFQENEAVLKKQLEEYENLLKEVSIKYLKEDAVPQLVPVIQT